MDFITKFLKGLAISVSTLVPGVSGGTMAIILGVYDDIIHAIGSFFEDWKKHSMLLIQIGLGGVIGIIAFSKIIDSALNKFPILMGFFFIGVVIGGIPTIYKRATVKDKNKTNLFFLLVGFIIALFMSSEPDAVSTMATAGGSASIIFLMIAGFIIAVALILPGISGSFMLLILGLYDITLNAINNFNITFLVPLAIGGLIGTVATTKTIEKLLNKYPGKTYMLILGFVLGSIIPIYPGIPSGAQSIVAILVAVIGFALIYFISKIESIKES